MYKYVNLFGILSRTFGNVLMQFSKIEILIKFQIGSADFLNKTLKMIVKTIWYKKAMINTHPNLHQEVPQMLFEGGYILIQIEHTLHHDLDLVVRQMGKCRSEQSRCKLLYIQNVVRCGSQLAVDSASFHQREYVRQYGGVHR